MTVDTPKTANTKHGLRQSLAFRQAAIAVSAALVLGALFACVQVYLDMNDEIRRIHAIGPGLSGTVTKPAARSAHRLDQIVAQETIDVLIGNKGVYAAAILNDFGDTLYGAERQRDRSEFSFLNYLIGAEPIVTETPLTIGSPPRDVGKLVLHVDPQEASAGFQDRVFTVFIGDFVKSLSLAVILFFAFHLTATKRIQRLLALVRGPGAEAGPNTVPAADRSAQPHPDEIDVLALAFEESMENARRTRRQLVDERERFRHFSKVNADFQFELDQDLRVTFMSEEYRTMLGYPLSDVVGNHVVGLPLQVDDDGAWQANVESVMRRHQNFRNVIGERKKIDGTPIWISLSGMARFDEAGAFAGYRCTGRDVTAIVKVKEALEQSERALRSLFDHSPYLISLKTPEDSRYQFVNKAAAAFFGKKVEDCIGKTTYELFSPEHADAGRSHEKIVIETKQAVSQTRTVDTPHGRAVLRVDKFPILDRNGNVTQIGQIGTDITKYLETADKLRQSQKMETVGKLAGGIAHDVNNNLMVIRGNLELLEDAEVSEATKKRIERAIQATGKAAELTGRLLLFSRKKDLEPRFIDGETFIREVAPMIGSAVGGGIEIDLQSEPVPAVYADPVELENAILNLVVNAKHAMGDAGLLTVSLDTCPLNEQQTKRSGIKPGTYVRFLVKDTGVGMDAETRSRAFEPFFSTREKGTGLGLSTVFGFATSSDGMVTIDSMPGEGTEVALYLPTPTAEQLQASITSAQSPSAQGGHRCVPKKPTKKILTDHLVLVVEDDESVRDFVVETLQASGYKVLEAATCDMAKRLVRKHRNLSVLVTDIMLPGEGNGFELAEWAVQRTPNLGVIFTSGYAGEHLDLSTTYGSDINLLAKPYPKAELLRRVGHYFT